MCVYVTRQPIFLIDKKLTKSYTQNSCVWEFVLYTLTIFIYIFTFAAAQNTAVTSTYITMSNDAEGWYMGVHIIRYMLLRKQ